MELTKIVVKRYLKAKTKEAKGKILDEYCANTGLHRKYAITKIRNFCFKDQDKKKQGRKTQYSSEANALLIQVWEMYDKVCGERLQPFLEEGIKKLEQFGHIHPKPSVRTEVLKMSIASVKRRIQAERHRHGKSQFSTTKPGSLLKKAIPIQTLCWNEEEPGFCEIDLVAHCGGSLLGNFIYTLQFVDIKTTWTERKAVMGKGQEGVLTAIKEIRELLPFPLKGIDSDNGSEFINYHLVRYCDKEKIRLTRSRPYMKKDNAHIEQKNYPLVRKILGYDRFDTPELLKLINDLYDNELRLYINFFKPSMKLIDKVRVGSKYKRKYDTAKTPYQRVIDCNSGTKESLDKLKSLYHSLDPVLLKQSIDKKISHIISLVR